MLAAVFVRQSSNHKGRDKMGPFAEQLKSELAGRRAAIEKEEQLRQQQFRAAGDLVQVIGDHVAYRLLQDFASALNSLTEKPGAMAGPTKSAGYDPFTCGVVIKLPVKEQSAIVIRVTTTIRTAAEEPNVLLEMTCCYDPLALKHKTPLKNVCLHSAQTTVHPADPTLVKKPTEEELMPNLESLDKCSQEAAVWYKAELTKCAEECLRIYCRAKCQAG